MSSTYECLFCEEEFVDTVTFKLHLWKHFGTRERSEERILKENGSDCIPESCLVEYLDSFAHDRDTSTKDLCKRETTPLCDNEAECKKDVSSAEDDNTSLNDDNFSEENSFEESSDSNQDTDDKRLSQASLNKEHIAVNAESFACPLCGKLFTSQWCVKRHQAVHEKPSEYRCKICDKLCSKPSLLKQHVKFLHSEKPAEPVSCVKCGKSFPTERQLRKHGRIHSEVRHSCEHCTNVYKHNFDLLAHCRAAHGQGKSYECETCSRKFSSQSRLERHEEIHTNVRFSCGICSKSYKQHNSLTNHMKSHRGQEGLHKCDKCTLMYTSSSTLKIHKEAAHGPVVEHACTQCDKIFYSRESLRLHAKRHEGARKRRCTHCNEELSSSWSLKKHIERKHASPD